MNSQFTKQVDFLLRILPEVAKETDLALHGGSAINLFYFEMPRLSVDIDLTYLPFGARDKDLRQIKALLIRIKTQLLKIIPQIKIKGPKIDVEDYKLYCSLDKTEVKIEINTINRGVYHDIELHHLRKKAQDEFNRFCEMQIVPLGQLFEGKIVAALDRQHPRDLFDFRKMMEVIGFTNDVSEGFLFCLLSSKRPVHEILRPSFIDHNSTLISQFSGMTDEVFSYGMYGSSRELLVETVHKNLTPEAHELLLSFTDGQPKWGRFDYERFPGIQWKLLNIRKLKKQNPNKHLRQLFELEKALRT